MTKFVVFGLFSSLLFDKIVEPLIYFLPCYFGLGIGFLSYLFEKCKYNVPEKERNYKGHIQKNPVSGEM